MLRAYALHRLRYATFWVANGVAFVQDAVTPVKFVQGIEIGANRFVRHDDDVVLAKVLL